MRLAARLGFGMAALLAGTGAQAGAEYLGNYEGTGRACAGSLHIEASRLDWRTPFSRCGGSSYRASSRPSAGNKLEVEIQLLNPGKACRYPFLLLTHAPDAPSGTGWAVLGFPNAAALEARDAVNALDCYLVK